MSFAVKALRHLGSGLIDAFYPRDCILTGEPLDRSPFRYLSERAFNRLPMIRDPRCPTCGHPFFGAIETAPVCHHCELLHPVFEKGRCGFVLNRDIRDMVHAFKYDGKRYLAPDLADLLARCPGFLDFLAGSVVVPVPLHPKKQRKRGFNQAGEILRHLSARHATGRFEIRPLLRRLVDTPTQTTADRRERLARVKNAFALRDDVRIPPKDRRVLVFDDVFTTGATLNTCSRILRKAGNRRVDVAAFAHG